MRATLSCWLLIALILSANIHASDEIEFESDPIVTVDVEEDPSQSKTLLSSYLLFGTGISLLAVTTTWLYFKYR